ncbi:hypothetical protein [Haloarcula nitratireducens]|uniref:Cbb3-type cytochrome oxidase assembly protein CcoS n=1 Tax=Haloarcula nitratireducens TaxID=2487749 RepID=A0AAW4P7F5_9EURY|nr:hypothetical protein [Halomicroarcula nitratireducens]MBX0293692.1 hypothetical protein [Halomicroarcula nitratireducens]
MSSLLQSIDAGGLLVVALLLAAMAIPVLIALGVALWLTRDEWGDRKDFDGFDTDESGDEAETAVEEPESANETP